MSSHGTQSIGSSCCADLAHYTSRVPTIWVRVHIWVCVKPGLKQKLQSRKSGYHASKNRDMAVPCVSKGLSKGGLWKEALICQEALLCKPGSIHGKYPRVTPQSETLDRPSGYSSQPTIANYMRRQSYTAPPCNRTLSPCQLGHSKAEVF